MSLTDDGAPERSALPLSRVRAKAAPLRELVASSLREAIVDGRFPPGRRLIERELMEWTTVSRTTVREALRQLESEGLVEIIPNQGPAVAVPTRREVEEIYELRAVLEGHASRQFATNASDAQCEAFAAMVEELAELVESGEPVGSLRALKERMYDLLFEGAGNSVAKDIFMSLNSRISILRNSTLSRPDRPAETLAEVKALADAFADRDGDLAAAAAAFHVGQAAAVALSFVDQT